MNAFTPFPRFRRPRKFTEKALRELWDTDKSVLDIAAELGVTHTTVRRRAKGWDLPDRNGHDLRRKRRHAARNAPPPIPEAEPVPGPLTTEERIRATGGKYAPLEALRSELGLTHKEIACLWHRVRRG